MQWHLCSKARPAACSSRRGPDTNPATTNIYVFFVFILEFSNPSSTAELFVFFVFILEFSNPASTAELFIFFVFILAFCDSWRRSKRDTSLVRDGASVAP